MKMKSLNLLAIKMREKNKRVVFLRKTGISRLLLNDAPFWDGRSREAVVIVMTVCAPMTTDTAKEKDVIPEADIQAVIIAATIC